MPDIKTHITNSIFENVLLKDKSPINDFPVLSACSLSREWRNVHCSFLENFQTLPSLLQTLHCKREFPSTLQYSTYDIYIYASGRCFYPKQHALFYQFMHSLGLEPMPLTLLGPCSYTLFKKQLMLTCFSFASSDLFIWLLAAGWSRPCKSCSLVGPVFKY